MTEFVESAPAPRRPARGAGRASLRLLLPAALLVPLALQGFGALMAWNAAWDQAEAEVLHTADAAAEYGRSVLEVQRQRAERVNQLLDGLDEAQIRAREPALHDALRRVAGPSQGETFAIFVFGRQTELLLNTVAVRLQGVDYRDRDYLAALRGPDAPRLHLGEVLQGRATDIPFFPMTVRREGSGDPAAQDDFPGVINIALRPSAIAQGLARLRGEAGDVISLVRPDGAVLARTLPISQPPPWRQSPGAEVTARMAAGEARFLRYGTSPLDGARRIAAYRLVEGWPVYVAAARNRETVVARWRDRVAGLLAFGMPATLGLALLAHLVQRAWRSAEAARDGLEDRVRHRTAELADRTEELAASENRLRLALEAADLGIWEADFAAGTAMRSARSAAILGLPPEPNGIPMGGWRDRIHKADLPAAQAGFEALRLGTTDRYAAEYRVRHDDGHWVWVESRARAVARDAAGRALRVAGTLQDVTERREVEQRRALLAREVDHRAKNALAVVQAALRLTPRTDPDSYAAAVEGRVAALARAHTLLAEQRWAGAELRQLLAGELAAFIPQPQRVELEGPAMQVAASAAQSLSLAFHELATNAVKYGALSTPGGRLLVGWNVTAAELALTWRETGGPPVPGQPERRGFGTRVIAATLRDQLGGTLDKRWLPEGLVVEMRIPLARIRAGLAAELDTPLQPMV